MSRTFVRLLLAALLLASPLLYAAPSQVGQGAFTNPIILDFNIIPNEVPITTQYLGQGVTFSGAIYGMTNPGDTHLFPGPPVAIASDWLYSHGGHGPLPIAATFGSTENLVGFLDEANTGDITTITTFLGGVSHGSVSYTSLGITPVFFGVSDPIGFDSITIDMSGPDNHFIGMDVFQYQSSTPEPGSLLLLGSGVLGLAGVLRRKIGL
jgi:hypothetical protein